MSGEVKDAFELLHNQIRPYELSLLAFQREQAEQVTAIIKEHASRIPNGNYDAMRQAAADINEILDRLHLAIRDPLSGKPAMLVVGKNNEAKAPRFRLKLTHHHTQFTTSSVRLDALELSLIPDTSKSHTPRLRQAAIGR